MRVLQANKFFYLRGGAERYLFDLLRLLPGRGHEVAPFSMSHPRNQDSPYSRHFVSPVDYARHPGPVGLAGTALRTVYSRETRRRVRDLCGEFRPEVAHLHNVHHQLSGSLFESLASQGVPIVQTLHDFQWVCPVYTFLSHGTICEACGHGRYLPAIQRRCHGGSFTRSLVAATELGIGYLRGWERRISLFLAPSQFLADRVVAHGLPADKVVRINYCLDLKAYVPRDDRDSFVLYAGRLSHEKGVDLLLRAAALVPGLRLRIAGTGPLEPDLRRRADAIAHDRVTFLGHLSPTELRREIGSAAFAVVPSTWFENQPLAVLEAFAMATPVVAADIGGLPELVRPDETGLLAVSDSVESLADTLAAMQSRSDLRDMGRRARAFVETNFDPDRHLEELESLYRRAVG